MHSVFKYSLALLAVSAGAGQAWVHKSANAGEVASMAAISRKCPALAIEARPGQASKYDAVTLRDAYWRVRIADTVSWAIGHVTDGCAG
jgi:hypothetical protein